MKNKIYKTYLDFLQREKKELKYNGYSTEELLQKYAKTNINCTGCYDCESCTDCKECSTCYNCTKCTECAFCEDSNKLEECYECTNCENCLQQEGLINKSNIKPDYDDIIG